MKGPAIDNPVENLVHDCMNGPATPPFCVLSQGIANVGFGALPATDQITPAAVELLGLRCDIARSPRGGGNNGTWSNDLNQFLLVGHHTNGTNIGGILETLECSC
jgi:hypothetical protein